MLIVYNELILIFSPTNKTLFLDYSGEFTFTYKIVIKFHSYTSNNFHHQHAQVLEYDQFHVLCYYTAICDTRHLHVHLLLDLLLYDHHQNH